VLTLRNTPTQEARSRFEFLLPAGDDQLYLGIDRMCDLLGKIGVAAPMPFVLKKSKLVSTDKRADYLRGELRKKTGRIFVSSSPSRVVTTESTFVHGEPDVWSGLTFRLRIEYPSLPWPDQEDLLVKAGDILGALTGFVTPSVATEQLLAHSSLGIWNQPLATETLKDVSRGLREAMMRAGVSLPLIHRMYLGGVLTHRAQPETLGWLNYWSTECSAYLGFPQVRRDADLLEHSYRTPGGAWLVKLTADPLDVFRDDHVRLLASTYARFPKLGIRHASWQTPPPSDLVPDSAEHASVALVVTLVVVESPNPGAVAAALHHLLNVQAPSAKRADVTAGARGWSVIVTDPMDLLAETGSTGKPLIGELCRQLQVIGCMLCVRGPVDAVLIESDTEGCCYLSGNIVSEENGTRSFHGTPIDEPLLRFHVMPFKVDLLDIDDYTQLLRAIQEEFLAASPTSRAP